MPTRQELEALNVRLKRVLSPRLGRRPPHTAGACFLAGNARSLTPTEGAVAAVILSWTFSRYDGWQPMAFVTHRQFAEAIGLIWGGELPNQGHLTRIKTAISGLERKHIAHRILMGMGQPVWYHLALVEQQLGEPHEFHDGEEPDDEERGDVAVELEDLERISKREAMRVAADYQGRVRRRITMPDHAALASVAGSH